MKKEINTDLLFPNGAEVNIIPVMQGMEMTKVNTSDLPKVIPLLALRNAVVFPGMVFPVTIGRDKSINVMPKRPTPSSEPSLRPTSWSKTRAGATFSISERSAGS